MSVPATDFAPTAATADTASARTAFERAEAAADPRTAVEHYLRATDEGEAAREWLLAAVAGERAAELLAPADPARAARLFQRAAVAYEGCGRFGDSRRMALRESGLKLWRGKELEVGWGHRAELFAAWLTSGFGLKPLRVLGTALVATVGFALLFWLGGGVHDADGRPLTGFDDALYLSGVTISTVGYGDVKPDRHLRFAAVAEGWLGLILFSYFVAVLSNRLRH